MVSGPTTVRNMNLWILLFFVLLIAFSEYLVDHWRIIMLDWCGIKCRPQKPVIKAHCNHDLFSAHWRNSLQESNGRTLAKRKPPLHFSKGRKNDSHTYAYVIDEVSINIHNEQTLSYFLILLQLTIFKKES